VLEAIVISDVHLGSRLCRTDLLDSFLRGLPATRRLILNGDVMESSEYRLRRDHWRILSKLRKLADNLELVWIRGNHDYDADSIAHILGAAMASEYTFSIRAVTYLCTHGDQWDDFTTNRPVATFFFDLIYGRIQGYSPRLSRHLKRTSKTFLHCCQKVREGARKLGDKRKAKVVLCGHTHQPEAHEHLGYFNSGCWTEEECHYLTIDGTGLVQLLRYEKPPEFIATLSDEMRA